MWTKLYQTLNRSPLEWTKMDILHNICPLSCEPPWTFYWTLPPSSCPRSYWMTPNPAVTTKTGPRLGYQHSYVSVSSPCAFWLQKGIHSKRVQETRRKQEGNCVERTCTHNLYLLALYVFLELAFLFDLSFLLDLGLFLAQGLILPWPPSFVFLLLDSCILPAGLLALGLLLPPGHLLTLASFLPQASFSFWTSSLP